MVADAITYFWLLISHWATLMTGGIAAAIFLLVERIRGKQFEWRTVFVLIVCGFFVASYQTWHDQYETIKANPNRPWVAIDGVTSVGELFFFPDLSPTLVFNVRVRVSGQNPAQKVIGLGWLVPQRDLKLLELQKSRCDQAVNAPIPKDAVRGGQTIFAGQTPEVEVFAADTTGAFGERHRMGNTKILPSVIGCVAYAESEGNPHWTGFIYDLFAREPKNASGVKAIDLVPGRLPPDQIVFRPNDLGSGPAN